jgi:putative ribosome biogenesis GTPase RsgA
VKEAVDAGRVPRSRYQSYLEIVTSVRERAKNKRW